jgi:hypothetical protein
MGRGIFVLEACVDIITSSRITLLESIVQGDATKLINFALVAGLAGLVLRLCTVDLGKSKILVQISISLF